MNATTVEKNLRILVVDDNRAIHDVDDRAQAGITKAQSSADTANASAQNASAC